MNFDSLVKRITEAPVSEIGLHGDWDSEKLHRFDRPSMRALKKEGYLEKVKSKFAKDIGIDFNLFFVKSAQAGKHREVGIVSPDSLRSMISDVNMESIVNSSNPNNITIVFTNNVGDQKVPLTPWIIAHRTSHALYRGGLQNNEIRREYNLFMREYQNTLKHCYGISINEYGSGVDKDNSQRLKRFFSTVGTFKSARDKKVIRPFEFIHECFAQYLMEGGVTFNEGRERMCSYELQTNFEALFSHVLRKSQGKIFVM
jgi:hypothetical protein